MENKIKQNIETNSQSVSLKSKESIEQFINALPPDQYNIVMKLMATGYFSGIPFYNSDKENLRRNLFSHSIIVDGIEVITVKVRDGFEFAF